MQQSTPTKKALAEQIWLAYYNRQLLARGIISESTYRRMAAEIHGRKTRSRDR